MSYNNDLREVRQNLYVCPGCDEPIDGLAKAVDDWLFHDLNCRNKAIEKGIVIDSLTPLEMREK